MSDPSVSTVHPDSHVNGSSGDDRLHHTLSPIGCGVEADDFQTDCQRLAALIEAT